MDIGRVLHDLNHDTPQEKAEKYRRVFGDEAGLYVLLDILVTHGQLGKLCGPDMQTHTALYANGARDAVLKIAAAAGTDPFQLSAYLTGLDRDKRQTQAIKHEGEPDATPEPTDDHDDAARPGGGGRWIGDDPPGGDASGEPGPGGA